MKYFSDELTSGEEYRSPAPGLGDVLRELVRVGDLVRQVRGHELGGEVRLEEGCLVGEHGIGGRVGLVESVSGEGHEELEDLVRLFRGVSLGHRPFDEGLLLLRHLLGFLLSHGPAENVRLAEGVAADDPGDFHDLLW